MSLLKSALTLEEAVRKATADQLRTQLLQRIGYMSMGLAGAGIGARGLMSLQGLGRRNLTTPKASPAAPVTLDVPYPVESEEKSGGAVGQGVTNFLKGDYATSMAGVPWAMPASFAAGAGSLYGGWKFADWLLDKRRKSELKGELDQAKQEYESALLSNYDSPRPDVHKVAGENKLAVALDALYDQCIELEKQGLLGEITKEVTDPDNYMNGLGLATGVYGLGGGIAAALTAKAVFDTVRKRQQASLLRRAQASRRRKLYASQPSPLYAHPVPVAG